jgi:hypothetical protein
MAVRVTGEKLYPTITFANPYLVCELCKSQVKQAWWLINLPCGHRADYINTKSGWSPVRG